MGLADVVAPHTLDEHARLEMGITKPFPKTVREALAYLVKDTELCGALGIEIVRAYKSVKEVCSPFVCGVNESVS